MRSKDQKNIKNTLKYDEQSDWAKKEPKMLYSSILFWRIYWGPIWSTKMSYFAHNLPISYNVCKIRIKKCLYETLKYILNKLNLINQILVQKNALTHYLPLITIILFGIHKTPLKSPAHIFLAIYSSCTKSYGILEQELWVCKLKMIYYSFFIRA